MKKPMSQVMDVAAVRLDGEFVLIGYEDQGDQFRTWIGIGAETSIAMMECAAHQILSRIAEIQASRTDDCAGCDQCQSRVARMQAAMAALNPDNLVGARPAGAVH
ncbi:hypothetical protein [Brevundimonas sp.]|uniref:hypothetical protein n=1 Tax=Brevundimonas sp. TaxID=1871086 RepID=UPI0026051B8E|nr:hypothetical protein [Brevundimonas sp.]